MRNANRERTRNISLEQAVHEPDLQSVSTITIVVGEHGTHLAISKQVQSLRVWGWKQRGLSTSGGRSRTGTNPERTRSRTREIRTANQETHDYQERV